MRTIERTHRFKRDYRRESRGHRRADLDKRLAASGYPGVNVNALLPRGPSSFEPLSNQAHMTGLPVEVEALA